MDSNSFSSRKQVAFDLKEDLLRQHYPRPQHTNNPRFYTKAWDEISRFMKSNGWEHRQKSVYTSSERLTTLGVGEILEKMAHQLPWLYKCVGEIDITDIGDAQHSLKQALQAITETIEIGEPEIAVPKGK